MVKHQKLNPVHLGDEAVHLLIMRSFGCSLMDTAVVCRNETWKRLVAEWRSNTQVLDHAVQFFMEVVETVNDL